MELILTWVIKAEHTGALLGNPSFDWIKENYNFVHQLPAPSLHQQLAPSLHQQLAPSELGRGHFHLLLFSHDLIIL